MLLLLAKSVLSMECPPLAHKYHPQLHHRIELLNTLWVVGVWVEIEILLDVDHRAQLLIFGLLDVGPYHGP